MSDVVKTFKPHPETIFVDVGSREVDLSVNTLKCDETKVTTNDSNVRISKLGRYLYVLIEDDRVSGDVVAMDNSVAIGGSVANSVIKIGDVPAKIPKKTPKRLRISIETLPKAKLEVSRNGKEIFNGLAKDFQ